MSEEWKAGDPERRSAPEDLGWIKKMLITSMFGLIGHFSMGIWWAATMEAKVDFIQQNILQIKTDMREGTADRYTGADASKDINYLNSKIDSNTIRINALESRTYKGSAHQ